MANIDHSTHLKGMKALAVAVALFGAFPAVSQTFPPFRSAQPPAGAPLPAGPSGFSYADLADLAAPAPITAQITVRRASALRERDAPGVAPGHRRFFVEADLRALIRGRAGLPREVSYLVDLPNDARGRAARLRRGDEYLIFAEAVPGRPGELRLAAPDAHIPWSPHLGEQVRRILAEATAPDAPPRITGIGRAFHVPGSLPGESETQIFLQTADQRPVSLTVLRRPGERPRWAVALSEMVDAAARPPEPDSFLWYRLACTLPRTLPAQSLRDLAPGEARSVEEDYRLVIERLGPCPRNRSAAPR